MNTNILTLTRWTLHVHHHWLPLIWHAKAFEQESQQWYVELMSHYSFLHSVFTGIKFADILQSLVGGTNLMLMPEMQIAMTSLHFLSPDSKSHSFDDRANGYARGEGAAVIVIKPLHAALRDGDPIRAVIRNTGVNVSCLKRALLSLILSSASETLY
jgi:hypothetical protein